MNCLSAVPRKLLLKLIGGETFGVHPADERKFEIAIPVYTPGVVQLLRLQCHDRNGVVRDR